MPYAPRPRIGLSNVVYAVLDESTDVTGGTPSYGAITPLANALELSFDPAGNESMLFADDGPAFLADNVGEMKISFGIADINPADLAIVLGHSYANGVMTDSPTDQSPYIAIGAKRLRAGKQTGALVYDYFWLAKVKLMKPKEDAKTKGASIEFQTPMLEGMVVQLIANGNYRSMARSDDANLPAATITNWFTQVVINNTADLTALTVAIAAGGSAKTVTFTFSKASNSGAIPFTMSAAMIANWLSAIQMVKVVSGTALCTYSLAVTTPGAGFSNNTIVITATIVTGATSADNLAVIIPANSAVKDNSGVSVTAVAKAPILLA
jgi:phi13 family phage major tail protein